jgi:hypothetical protein
VAELPNGTSLPDASYPAAVTCTPPDKRRLYREEHGVQNPIVRWRWDCFVTAERISSTDEAEAHKLMLAHDCKGAGWCSVRMTPERVALLGRPHLPEPTPEDRERWNKLREAKRKAKRKARAGTP